MRVPTGFLKESGNRAATMGGSAAFAIGTRTIKITIKAARHMASVVVIVRNTQRWKGEIVPRQAGLKRKPARKAINYRPIVVVVQFFFNR